MKEFSCKDVGYECDFTIRETDQGPETDQRIIQRAIEHGRQVHGLRDDQINDALREKIRSKIHDTDTSQQPQSA